MLNPPGSQPIVDCLKEPRRRSGPYLRARMVVAITSASASSSLMPSPPGESHLLNLAASSAGLRGVSGLSVTAAGRRVQPSSPVIVLLAAELVRAVRAATVSQRRSPQASCFLDRALAPHRCPPDCYSVRGGLLPGTKEQARSGGTNHARHHPVTTPSQRGCAEQHSHRPLDSRLYGAVHSLVEFPQAIAPGPCSARGRPPGIQTFRSAALRGHLL